jgi:hypothetical protein
MELMVWEISREAFFHFRMREGVKSGSNGIGNWAGKNLYINAWDDLEVPYSFVKA